MDDTLEDNPRRQRGCGKHHCWPAIIAFVALAWRCLDHPPYLQQLVLLDLLLSVLFTTQVLLQAVLRGRPRFGPDHVWDVVEALVSLFCLVVGVGAILSTFFAVAMPSCMPALQFIAACMRLSFFLQLPARFRSCGQQLVLVDIGREPEGLDAERGRLLSRISFQYGEPHAVARRGSGDFELPAKGARLPAPGDGGHFEARAVPSFGLSRGLSSKAPAGASAGMEEYEDPNPFNGLVVAKGAGSLGPDPDTYHIATE
eukprot:EG_transcript_20231